MEALGHQRVPLLLSGGGSGTFPLSGEGMAVWGRNWNPENTVGGGESDGGDRGKGEVGGFTRRGVVGLRTFGLTTVETTWCLHSNVWTPWKGSDTYMPEEMEMRKEKEEKEREMLLE